MRTRDALSLALSSMAMGLGEYSPRKENHGLGATAEGSRDETPQLLRSDVVHAETFLDSFRTF